MLDTRKIGSYISKLRKEKDWTQMELADRLNVSHQAVSKWERGESLPDIGTLMQIGQVFGVSVDALMNGGTNQESSTYIHNLGRIMTGFTENRREEVAEIINTGEVDIEGLIEVAPLLKASELAEVTERVDKRLFNQDLIMRLAPFVETELLDGLVTGALEESVDMKFVLSLAPFLSRDALRD